MDAPREPDMKIARVFNNNIVLALDEAGREVILTGRGLGFRARPGQAVDASKVVRRFVPSDGRDADHLAQLLSGIPQEHIELVADALTEAGVEAGSPSLLVAMADHVSFALRRMASGIDLEYPLRAEVQHLYAREYHQARTVLAAINARSSTQLPETEAVALALHLVNAGFATGDLSYTYTMTGVIQQVIEVLGQLYGMQLDRGSVGVGRFVTHLRYLFVRIHQHRQLTDEHSAVGTAIREAYPRAADAARRIAGILGLRLGASLTEDEVSYLTLHIVRLTNESEGVG